MKYPTLLIALAFIAALTNCQAVNSQDLSILTGLHVNHFGDKYYYDHANNQNEGASAQRRVNEGALNNRLLGITFQSKQTSLTYLNFTNSFHEKSHGLGVSESINLGRSLSFEAGVLMLTGYRPAVTQGVKNPKSTKSKPMVAPLLALNYHPTKKIKISYALMTGNVGILTLSQSLHKF